MALTRSAAVYTVSPELMCSGTGPNLRTLLASFVHLRTGGWPDQHVVWYDLHPAETSPHQKWWLVEILGGIVTEAEMHDFLKQRLRGSAFRPVGPWKFDGNHN